MALSAGDILTYDGTAWVNQPAVQGPFGVGTVSPSSLLHVVGSQPAAVAGNGSPATQVLQVTGGKGGNTTGTTGQIGGQGGAINLTAGAGGDAPSGSTNATGANVTLQGGAPGSGAGTANSYGNVFLAPSGGKVGIGSSFPSATPLTPLHTGTTQTGTVDVATLSSGNGGASDNTVLAFHNNAGGYIARLGGSGSNGDTALNAGGGVAFGTGSATFGSNRRARITSAGNIVLGPESVMANAATDGFIYVRTVAGTPSGTPTGFTGQVALVYDTTANKLWVYNGAWKSVALT